MNILSRIALAGRVALHQAKLAARVTYRKPSVGQGVLNRYEAGLRFQFGERSYIWSYVTDARFDASQATRIEMVRKARYFEQNCPLVQRLADVWEQYVVGANGIIMSPDSQDEDWNLAAGQWFDEWAVYPDLVSLQNWSTLQSLIARTWFIDGEVFLLKTRSERAPYRPRLQLIEGHRVCTPPGLVGSPMIVDGVEIDAKGRPVAYHVAAGFDANEFERIPAENIIHVFEPARIGMYRGLTHFYAVMNALHDLDDLQKLEMQVAKRLASTPDIVKTPTGEMLDDAAQWDAQTEAASQGQQNPLTEYYARIFGATTKVMKIGDEYVPNTFDRPSVAQQWYWRFLMEEVCTGVGIPLVLVYPDSMQGTVYRGVLDTANAFFRSRSAVLAAALKQAWIYVIGAGANQDFRIANKPADWTLLSARPPRAVNVDVGRNSSAMLSELAAGTRTWQDVFAETGDDWKSKLRQRAREARYIRDLATEYDVEPNEISDVIEIPPPLPPGPIIPGGNGNSKGNGKPTALLTIPTNR